MAVDISKIKACEVVNYSIPYLPSKQVNIFIVGGGGTGSYLLPNLLRIAKFSNLYNIKITVIDGDVLEEKNLVRQNFHSKYINQKKSRALADTWGKFVGYPVAYMERYLEDAADMEKVFLAENGFVIICGCVDSMQCRAEIDKFMKNTKGRQVLWIDSGNEEFYGQTIVSTNYKAVTRNGIAEVLPTFCDIAPDLFTPDKLVKTSEISCAEHAEENIQNIAANIQAANNMFMVLNQLLAGGAIEYKMLSFDVRTMDNKRTLI